MYNILHDNKFPMRNVDRQLSEEKEEYRQQ